MIVIYSKTSCGICEAAKQKLKLMNYAYTEHDLDKTMSPHAGWRTDGSEEVVAGWALMQECVPLISITGEWYTYSGAMRRLRRDTN